MKNHLLLFLGLALLALAAYLFLTPPDTTESPDLEQEAGDLMGTVEQQPILEIPTTHPAVDLKRTTESSGEASEAGQDSPTGNSKLGTFKIQVLEAGTDRPLPEAEVWTVGIYRLKDLSTSEQAFLSTRPDPEEQVKHFSQAYLADKKGFVTLPIREGGQQVVGRKGELFAFKPFFGYRNRVLHLQPDQGTKILVLDHAGQPLSGIPIGLATRNERGLFPSRDSTTLSDSSGIAHLRHLQLWWDPKEKQDLLIMPHVLLRDEISVSLESWMTGDQKGNLTMPPLGSLAIEVLDWDGNPQRGPLIVFVAPDPQPENPPEAKKIDLYKAQTMTLRIDLHGNSTKIPHVGLGLHLAVLVRGDELQVDSAAYGVGPWQEGETVQLSAKPDRPSARYRMRLVEEDGSPLPMQDLVLLTTTRDSQSWQSGDHATDKDGIFVYLPDADTVDRLQDPSTSFRLRSSGNSDYPPMQGLVVAPQERDGFQDLGDILMSTDKLLTAGKVLDASGNAIEDARLWATLVVEHSYERDHATTNQLGGFSMFREFAGDSLSLSVEKMGFVRQTLEVPAGSSDLVITMKQGRMLEGKVLFPPEVNAKAFKIRFLQDGKSHSPRGWLREDGSFTIEGLPPSPGVLSVVHNNQRLEMMSLADVTPALEGELQDPRLAALDLRDAIRFASIEVYDKHLAPLPDARIENSEKVGFLNGGYSDEQGVIHLYLGKESLGARIVAPGYLPKIIQVHEGEQSVEMEGGLKATLRLDPMPKIPKGYRLDVLAWRTKEDGIPIVFATNAYFDVQGNAEIQIPGPGTFGAYLGLADGENFYERLPSWDHQYEDGTFEITLENGLGVGSITVSQAEIDALVED